MKIPCALLTTTLILPISSAFAEGMKLSAAFDQCIAKAGAVNPAMLECIDHEYGVQDRRLNASYKALMAKLDAPRKKQLQDAQRLWLKYVEANCDFYSTMTRTAASLHG